MTLLEFKEKALVTNEDAVFVINVTDFNTVKSYIAGGVDDKVTKLLWALWVDREKYNEQQIIESLLSALFGTSTDIRWKAGTTALMFARRAGCEPILMAEVQAKWPSFVEQQTVSFLAAFSGFDGAEDWLSCLSHLFDSSPSIDVRARIINTIHNLYKVKPSSENQLVLKNQLERMPVMETAYRRVGNFQFIKKLKTGTSSFG